MRHRGGLALCLVVGLSLLVRPVYAQKAEVSASQVLRSIELGKAYLISQQNKDGSWSASTEDRVPSQFQTGVTSLALLSLLNSGMTIKDEPVQKALNYLRTKVREPEPDWIYEIALMAMAIQQLGVPAISFTGAQVGLVTDSFHTKARIRNISSERLVQELRDGKIVIVAGFQGID